MVGFFLQVFRECLYMKNRGLSADLFTGRNIYFVIVSALLICPVRLETTGERGPAVSLGAPKG